MNQGKLEVVKQEMARVNVDILGISELKWTGMGEFNSDDHYIYYCGQESLRRNGVCREAKRKQQLTLLSTARFLLGPHSHDIMIHRKMAEKGVFLLWAICLFGPARTTQTFQRHAGQVLPTKTF